MEEEGSFEPQPEATIEVEEPPSPPPLPQAEDVPASSPAGAAGNPDLVRAIVTFLGALTRLTNELCGAVQDYRRNQGAKK